LERAFVDAGMNELGEIPENITSVPNIPARESANQENITNNAENTGNINAQAGQRRWQRKEQRKESIL
jgi:hypothetical protein